MALTDKQRKILRDALADKTAADAIADMVEAGGNPVAEAVEDIADPGTATAEDVANKVNELMAAMRAAGMLAE